MLQPLAAHCNVLPHQSSQWKHARAKLQAYSRFYMHLYVFVYICVYVANERIAKICENKILDNNKYWIKSIATERAYKIGELAACGMQLA